MIYETSYASLNKFLDKDKSEEIRRRFLKREIRVRELTNQLYHEKYTKVQGFHENVMDIRYIDSQKLKIDTEVLIYNNVVAFYKLKDRLYGVEVYNSNLAEIQKKIFNYVWNWGEKPIIGKGGRTSLF